MSISSDKLEMICDVAKEVIAKNQLVEFDIVEVDLSWQSLDDGQTLLPFVTVRMEKNKNENKKRLRN